MKLLIESWEYLYNDNDDNEYITNLNVDKIMDVVLSCVDEFNVDDDILINTNDICAMISKFKDNNGIFKKDENVIAFEHDNIRYKNFQNFTVVEEDGCFSLQLHLDADDYKFVEYIEVMFFGGHWAFSLCHICYDRENDLYVVD